MKSLPATIAILAAALAPAAYADCSYPHAPEHLPNGNTATLKEMLAGEQAVKTYNEEMTAYLSCIQLERDSRVAQAGDNKLTKEQKQQLAAIEDQKHNAAVDQLQTVANRFNAQVKIFKARDKKSD